MAEDPLVDELVELGVEREEAVRLRLTGRAPLAMVEWLITGPTRTWCGSPRSTRRCSTRG
jgi:hypothetical protein